MIDAVTRRIAELCVDRLPGRVGPDSLKAARRCLIDSLAVALAAVDSDAIAMLRKEVAPEGASGPASLIGRSGRCPPDAAALVNGMMISLLLFDDNHGDMRGHPSAPVMPAVLALGQLGDRSLEDTLRAFVIGYEVECRLGLLLNPSHYERGWHATATQGTMGATAAAAALLGLGADQAMAAFGVAASLAGGLRRNFGTMTMSLHSGVAAANGVRAARLAARGFTADRDIFDGENGFGAVFSQEWRSEPLRDSLKSWGDPFAVDRPGPIFKLYPCGRPTLPAIECAIALRERHGVEPREIERVICEVSFLYPRTLIHSRPRTGLEGKTSLEYCVATALVDGHPSLASFTDAAVRRPEIADLIERIEVRVPPELSEEVPDVRRRPFMQPVSVELRTRDGRTARETVLHHKGMPENPASECDLRLKFERCATVRYDGSRARAILDYVDRPHATLRGLFDLLDAT